MKSAAVTLVLICLLLLSGFVFPASSVTRGRAFIYPDSVQGRELSSGEIYRGDRPTAGHAHLPLGSVARVRNLANNRWVDVIINDRWKGSPSSILLSEGAAAVIGLSGNRPISEVEIEVLPHLHNRLVQSKPAKGGRMVGN